MFDYRADSNSDVFPQGKGAVWSLEPLQPLAPGPLTPFSYSVLAEVVHKAWFRHFDQLGFAPSRTKIVRQHQGRPYLNIARSARLEAEHAGVEPLTLRVNGAPMSLCEWEKPGLMAGMRVGRARKRLQSQADALLSDIDAITARARTWYTKTVELKWSQAELLQVMEEIERVSLDAFAAFLVTRGQLQLTYNRLVWMLLDSIPFPQCLNLINSAIGDVAGLIESKMSDDLVSIAESVAQDERSLAWLQAGDYPDWQAQIAALPVAAELQKFLAAYGHRTAGEGEAANPRWVEDPAPICREVLVMIERETLRPGKLPSDGALRRLQNAAGKRAKDAAGMIDTLRQTLLLQSKATNAVAYLLAGTRNWVMAAGNEATSDGRLLAADDALYFELEELKQMMTGEWNVSARDEIQAQAAQRRVEYAARPQATPPRLLFGDAEITCTSAGLPGSVGNAVGPLRCWQGFEPQACNGAVVGAEQMDSGWSLILPTARGIVIAGGTPYDPIVAAGRHWHTPMMVGMGQKYAGLVEGAQTTLDVEQALIDQ